MTQTPDLIEVDYFTDPICSWSWAMEPQIARLRVALGARARWRLRLMGMLDSPAFHDPLQQIHRPAHWGPQWAEVSRQTGAPCDPRIWHDDPPHNSRLATLAVAAAGLQGERAERAMLRRAREGVMIGRENIARLETLALYADEIEARGALDATRWRRDVESEEARERVRQDMARASYQGVTRYPSIALRAPERTRRTMLIVGWRPWSVLTQALCELGVSAPPQGSPEELLAQLDGLTDQERDALGIPCDALTEWSSIEYEVTRVWRPRITTA